MTTEPAAPVQLDHDTILWVLEDIQLQIQVEEAARKECDLQGHKFGALFCQDRADTFRRYHTYLSRSYQAGRHL